MNISLCLKPLLLGILILVFNSCINSDKELETTYQPKVGFRFEQGMWKLYRNNEPYFVKGAHGFVRLDLLKKAGGNSIVIYENELSEKLLNEADSLGISVSVVLDVEKVRFAPNGYRDTDFVENQRRRIKETVLKYKDHPAILFWILGNELHLLKRFNYFLWREVNQLARLVKEIDPDHPTTTTVAAYPTQTFEPLQIKLFAPAIDFLSITVYEFAPRLRREAESFIWGINGPFLVTEWAGIPYWMYPRTEWDAIMEHSSTRNAEMFYHNKFLIFDYNPEKCIGGYVFYWGEKQERTHTVFSLILEEKYKMQALETLQHIWTETYPDNWAPRIDTFMIEGFRQGQHYLEPGQEYTAQILASDPDKDHINMKWILLEEGYYRGKTGGDAERIPEIISKSDTLMPYSREFKFFTPERDGQYRLFVYLYDNHDYVATANIPVYVMP